MDAPAAPALALKSDPCPGVEVFFDSVDGDAETITVWRVADGITEAVAGALRQVVSGAFVVTDWQAPFGVVSSYVGEIFDSSGASIRSLPSTIQVDSSDVWFQSQADPSQAFTVELEEASLGEVRRERRTQQQWVAGVSLPYEQNWGLGGIQGLPFTVYTESAVQAQAMRQLLASSPLLIRTPPRFVTLPRLLSASIKQPMHDPLDWQYGGAAIVWVLTVDEVQPISKAILRPLVTWDDWTAAFPADDFTWNDVLAIYGAGTWIDAVRNPPNA